MTDLAMFPLGSVLFPYMPLPLRVFEDRYLVMLSRILTGDPAQFGVVLIERGQEVGGGEQRFSVGTTATIAQLDATDEFVVLVAEGGERFEVDEWLDDEPYPKASIRALPDLEWTDALRPLRDRAENAVRDLMRIAGQLEELQWSPDVELSSDPTESSWQLAAILPVGPLDQIALLRSTTMEELLTSVLDLAAATPIGR